MDLRKFEDFKSVKKLNRHFDKYYSFGVKSRKPLGGGWLEDYTKCSEDRLTVVLKIEKIDVDYLSGNVTDIIDFLTTLKDNYNSSNDLSIERTQHWHCGDYYDGEDWVLLETKEESEEDFIIRQELIKKVKRDVKAYKTRAKNKKDTKEFQKYLELKEKFEE